MFLYWTVPWTCQAAVSLVGFVAFYCIFYWLIKVVSLNGHGKLSLIQEKHPDLDKLQTWLLWIEENSDRWYYFGKIKELCVSTYENPIEPPPEILSQRAIVWQIAGVDDKAQEDIRALRSQTGQTEFIKNEARHLKDVAAALMNSRKYSKARHILLVARQLAEDYSPELCEEIVEQYTTLCFESKDYSCGLKDLLLVNGNRSEDTKRVFRVLKLVISVFLPQSVRLFVRNLVGMFVMAAIQNAGQTFRAVWTFLQVFMALQLIIFVCLPQSVQLFVQHLVDMFVAAAVHFDGKIWTLLKVAVYLWLFYGTNVSKVFLALQLILSTCFPQSRLLFVRDLVEIVWTLLRVLLIWICTNAGPFAKWLSDAISLLPRHTFSKTHFLFLTAFILDNATIGALLVVLWVVLHISQLFHEPWHYDCSVSSEVMKQRSMEELVAISLLLMYTIFMWTLCGSTWYEAMFVIAPFTTTVAVLRLVQMWTQEPKNPQWHLSKVDLSKRNVTNAKKWIQRGIQLLEDKEENLAAIAFDIAKDHCNDRTFNLIIWKDLTEEKIACQSFDNQKYSQNISRCCHWLFKGIQVRRLNDLDLAVAIFSHSLQQLGPWSWKLHSSWESRARRLLCEALHQQKMNKINSLMEEAQKLTVIDEESLLRRAKELYTDALELAGDSSDKLNLTRSKLYLGRGAARYLQDKTGKQGIDDINHAKSLLLNEDVSEDGQNIALEVAKAWKKKADNEQDSRRNKRAQKLYLLSLECDDESDKDFTYSTFEQLIDVEFKLKAFTKAIQHGEECYTRSSLPSQNDSEKWKTRGRRLYKDGLFDLSERCYGLAIEYSPTEMEKKLLKGLQLLPQFQNEKKNIQSHEAELRDAWTAAESLKDLKTVIYFLDELRKCLQLSRLSCDKFGIQVQRRLADTYFKSNEHDKSIEISKEIMRISQEEIDSVASRGYRLLNHKDKNRPDEALKYFNTAYGVLNNKIPRIRGCQMEDALKGRALALLQMDCAESAVTSAREFVRIHQDVPSTEPNLHTCLRFGMRTGEFGLLKTMINKTDCNINECNEVGGTLCHLAAEENGCHLRFAVRILEENNADPFIKDHEGLVAGQKFASGNITKEIFEQARHNYKHKELEHLADLEQLRELVQTAIRERSFWNGCKTNNYHRANEPVPKEPYPHTDVPRTGDNPIEVSSEISTDVKDVSAACVTEKHNTGTNLMDSTSPGEGTKSDKLFTVAEDEGEIKAALWTDLSFEDLQFEVRCSIEVKEVLHGNTISPTKKKQILETIHDLADGRPRDENLCKKLNSARKRDLSLFEARVSKSERIIWQNAKEYSFQKKTYCPVIRVWKIVLKHKTLDDEVDKIVKSLKAPFGRYKDDQGVQTSDDESLLPVDSSPNEDYHSLKKFHLMTSYMIKNMLSGIQNVDYPFEATKSECEIIDLNPSPPCSIILLGRSGTGKTTCCLYRLWNEYKVFQQPGILSQKSVSTIKVENQVCLVPSTDSDSHQGVCQGAHASTASPSQDDDMQMSKEQRLESTEHPEKNEDVDHSEQQLHQIFISRNSILCEKVAKLFHSLRNAHGTPHIDHLDHPLRIQDMHEDGWPLFLSVLQWLMLLDASLPGKRFCPADLQHDDTAALTKTHKGKAKTRRKLKANRSSMKRMVTYEVFTSTFWPKMVHSSCKIHPSLVWTEIISFIKGSVDALESGELSLKEYESVGKKMAPQFLHDRDVVYNLYNKYKALKRSRDMFDECDFVFDVYKRLQEAQAQLQVHRIYVDEAQDLTQAELSLLVHCCHDPNGLFFAGDTAQTIMKGVSFRFKDLRKLLFEKGQIEVPKEIHQLTCNYRSHSGIVDLACAVIGLLQHFFPESFDETTREQGLFSGPKPVLIESSNFTHLADLLKGQQEKSTPIELGAHQVVLVRKHDSVPDELKEGLVMTVYEAKGLEFDDVLIFNFFKDSEAKEEWRVVANFWNEAKPKARDMIAGVAELNQADFLTETRPLNFDYEKHKILNSELKYLYTAITRARANVWFYDQDEQARGPLFEFFQNIQLATTSDEKVTAKRSSTQEWLAKGNELFKDRHWQLASAAFINAGDFIMAAKCKAQIQFAKININSSVADLLKVAKVCLDSDMAKEAAVALQNAREFDLLKELIITTPQAQVEN